MNPADRTCAEQPPGDRDLGATALILTQHVTLTLYDGGGQARSHLVLRVCGRAVLILAAADA